MADQQIRTRIHRPAASRTWEHTHRWGTQFGDFTDLRVTRTDGGGLSIAYGRESIDIREALVSVLAEIPARDHDNAGRIQRILAARGWDWTDVADGARDYCPACALGVAR